MFEQELGNAHAEAAQDSGHADSVKGNAHAEAAQDSGHADSVKGNAHAEAAQDSGHADSVKGNAHAEAAQDSAKNNPFLQACRKLSTDVVPYVLTAPMEFIRNKAKERIASGDASCVHNGCSLSWCRGPGLRQTRSGSC